MPIPDTETCQRLRVRRSAGAAGGPFPGTINDGGSTDLLINFTYRLAFNQANQQLGLASAIAMLIFVIVGTVAAYGFRLTRKLEEIGR